MLNKMNLKNLSPEVKTEMKLSMAETSLEAIETAIRKKDGKINLDSFEAEAYFYVSVYKQFCAKLERCNVYFV